MSLRRPSGLAQDRAEVITCSVALTGFCAALLSLPLAPLKNVAFLIITRKKFMKHIGFIGASGLTGHGIAKNLLAKGFQVSLTAHSRQAPLQDLLAAGAQLVDHHAALCVCDAVIICVTGSPQVEAALEGPQGLLSQARAGMLVVDASTSEPDSTRRLAARCQAVGMTLVDAPFWSR